MSDAPTQPSDEVPVSELPTVSELQPARDARIERAARALPRRRLFDDMPDKGLFGFVAVFGFALIVSLKLFHYDAKWVTILAVGLMTAYGLIAFRIPAVQMRLDRLGDNFYYLGFIYTLASMSAALIEVERGENIQALIGSFGIALFTTIVGVAGRVIFAQMRGEVDEVEAIVRRDLLATSNDLRSQLSASLAMFETFQTSVRQAAEEAASKSLQATEVNLGAVEAAAKGAAERIRVAFDENSSQAQTLRESVLKIGRVIETLSAQLGEQTERLGRELDQLVAEMTAAVARISGRKKRRWYFLYLR